MCQLTCEGSQPTLLNLIQKVYVTLVNFRHKTLVSVGYIKVQNPESHVCDPPLILDLNPRRKNSHFGTYVAIYYFVIVQVV